MFHKTVQKSPWSSSKLRQMTESNNNEASHLFITHQLSTHVLPNILVDKNIHFYTQIKTCIACFDQYIFHITDEAHTHITRISQKTNQIHEIEESEQTITHITQNINITRISYKILHNYALEESNHTLTHINNNILNTLEPYLYYYRVYERQYTLT